VWCVDDDDWGDDAMVVDLAKALARVDFEPNWVLFAPARLELIGDTPRYTANRYEQPTEMVGSCNVVYNVNWLKTLGLKESERRLRRHHATKYGQRNWLDASDVHTTLYLKHQASVSYLSRHEPGEPFPCPQIDLDQIGEKTRMWAEDPLIQLAELLEELKG
jgi:hypothetical protein